MATKNNKKLVVSRNNRKKVLKEAITILFKRKKDKAIASLFKHYEDLSSARRGIEDKIIAEASKQ